MLGFSIKNNILNYIAAVYIYSKPQKASLYRKKTFLKNHHLNNFTINKCFKAIVTCTFTEKDPANDNAGSYLQKN